MECAQCTVRSTRLEPRELYEEGRSEQAIAGNMVTGI